MRAQVATLVEWPAPVPMQRCDSDPISQLLRELDRLEAAVDGLSDIDRDAMPPTDPGTNAWGES